MKTRIKTAIRKAQAADVLLLGIPTGLVIFAAENHIGTVCVTGMAFSYACLIAALFILPLKWAKQ